MTWLEQLADAQAQMGRLRKFGARLANRELARSWSCLAEAGDERRRMKRMRGGR